MQLLDYIQVKTNTGFADIELYHGDLSAIPKEHAVDIVILSAYPNDYTPVEGTLIGALDNKGLSVAELSKNKEMDLRKFLWCWFSSELSPAQQSQFNFHHILCFEPEKRKDEAAEYVADIFRCLNNFVFEDDHNHVAMPTVAAGNQYASAIKITEAIIEAGIFWLQRGLPLSTIRIVEIDEQKANDLKNVFARYKKQGEVLEEENIEIELEIAKSSIPRKVAPLAAKPQLLRQEPPMPAVVTAPAVATDVKPHYDQFDVFISYSHKNRDHVNYFIEQLRIKYPDLRLFYDSDSIPKGGQWLKEISRCIDKSKKVLIFLSKEFDESPACWDEFQCAKVRQNRTGKNIIMNIYLLHHPELPSMFEIFNWIDCREADKQKMEKAIDELIGSIDR